MQNQTSCYYFQKVLSWLCFLAAVFCIFIFFINGLQQYYLLFIAFVLFILAYWISPHHKKRDVDFTDLFLDEWIIVMVFKIITWPFRLLGRIFDSGDISP